MKLKGVVLLFLLALSLGCLTDKAPIETEQPETTFVPTTEPPGLVTEPETTVPPAPLPPPMEPTTTTPPIQTASPPQPPLSTAEVLSDGSNYELKEIAKGFDDPLYLTHAGDGSGRLFVAEQGGVIKIIKNGWLLSKAFLDIRQKVRSGGEQGMLGLAFHPNFSRNGYFFVHYSDVNGDTVISRFTVSKDSDVADPNSEFMVLTQDQPYRNHNGGQIVFGPDGYLYIGLGDGGSGGDPHGNGQNLATLLGKILRIDVDSAKPYAAPPTNPFVGKKGRAEVWAYGLRNPWRFSFDRSTGDLYIADVGQNAWEEIDFQPADTKGGENYGWNQMEGNHCYTEGCDPKLYVAPVAEYSHGSGCSVTGGYIYRGKYDNGLNGVYLYGDYCSGLIWALLKTSSGEWANKLLIESGLSISSFGEDEEGEVYVVDHRGGIYWLKHKAIP